MSARGAARPTSPLNAFRDAVFSERGPPGGVARCVALAVVSQADTGTLETHIGIAEIARRSGFCERTVRAALVTLRAAGWIVERPRERGRPVYRIAKIPPDTPAAHAAPPRQDMPHQSGSTCRATPANDASEPRQMAPHTGAANASDLSKSLVKSLGRAASPVRAEPRSAAQDKSGDQGSARVWAGLRAGKTDDQIAAETGETLDRIRGLRQKREAMPLVRKQGHAG